MPLACILKYPASRLGCEYNGLLARKVELIDDLDGEMCDSGSTLKCVRLSSTNSVPGNLFGGDGNDVNNFKLMYYNF